MTSGPSRSHIGADETGVPQEVVDATVLHVGGADGVTPRLRPGEQVVEVASMPGDLAAVEGSDAG